jgi:hypothetical protein
MSCCGGPRHSVSLPGGCTKRHLICVKLRVINNSNMVLTMPGVRSTVNSYKSIIYTADQVHPRGEKGWLDDDRDQALSGAL